MFWIITLSLAAGFYVFSILVYLYIRFDFCADRGMPFTFRWTYIICAPLIFVIVLLKTISSKTVVTS